MVSGSDGERSGDWFNFASIPRGGHRGWPLCVEIGETIQKVQDAV